MPGKRSDACPGLLMCSRMHAWDRYKVTSAFFVRWLNSRVRVGSCVLGFRCVVSVCSGYVKIPRETASAAEPLAAHEKCVLRSARKTYATRSTHTTPIHTLKRSRSPRPASLRAPGKVDEPNSTKQERTKKKREEKTASSVLRRSLLNVRHCCLTTRASYSEIRA